MLYILITYLASPALYLLLFFRRRDAVKKILIIQTAKIGDLICSTPVFREIKKKYPDVHLTVMANPVSKELLEYNPHINKVISLKTTDYKGLTGKLKLSALIRAENYDAAICLNPNVPFSIALFWGLVPIRLSVMPNFSGLTFKLASIFFTYLERHARGTMVIETYMQMLKAIGISSNDISKEVYKSKDADAKAEQIIGKINKPLIGIAVSSGNKLKELGTKKIAELANMLLDNMDVYIVLIGSAQDRETANVVVNSVLKKQKIISTIGRLTLSELPALIERLSLFIGVDTGITYMADALSIPIVHIAGPSDMEDQRPTGKNALIIQNTNMPCVPCSHTFSSPYCCKIDTRGCIESASPKEIYYAAKKLLSKHN